MLSYYRTKMEVAREFGVAESTVRNWLKRAIEKKLNLQLESIDKSYYISRTEHNIRLIEFLIEEGRKHRKLDQRSTVQPSPEIYQIMHKKDLLSLVNTLEIYKTIPDKYSYLGRGAALWNETSINRQYNSSGKFDYFQDTFEKFILNHFADKKINLIDIGQGNSLPTIMFVNDLILNGRLNKYVSVDFSPSMIDISNQTLDKYGIPKEYRKIYHADFEMESLQKIFFELKEESGSNIANLAVMLDSIMGSTETTVKILQHVRDGMFPDDYLCVSCGYDTSKHKTYVKTLPTSLDRRRYIARLLGLNDEVCDTELIYNQEKNRRETNLILKKDVVIDIYPIGRELKFYRGEKVNVWFYKPETFKSISEKLDQAGLELHMIAKNLSSSMAFYMAGIK